jgi:hypothetical protein
MDLLSTTTTKGQQGWNAAKTAAQNRAFLPFTTKPHSKSTPPLANLSLNFGNPFAKRQSPRGFEQIVEQAGEALGELGEVVFAIGEVLGAVMAAYGPLAARHLGWAEAPKEKRTAPRVVAGAVIGAGAVYFLEPKYGPERREQLLRLINGGPPEEAGAQAQAAAAPAQPATAPPQPPDPPTQTT